MHGCGNSGLIRMKEVANRPKDIDDIQHLRWIMEDLDSDD